MKLVKSVQLLMTSFMLGFTLTTGQIANIWQRYGSCPLLGIDGLIGGIDEF